LFNYSIFLQAQTNQYIITGITIGALVFMFLAGLIVYFVLVYQKRQQQNDQEKKIMQSSFEQEILKTELEVKEQTLQTIAADLHDNIGQLLSLTNATLSSINVQDPIKTEQKVHTALGFVNSSIKDLRQLAKLLQAENLLQQGLINAIEQEVNWLQKSEQYDVQFINHLNSQFPNIHNKSLFVFRLLQETISNIIKHADANKIVIEIGEEGKNQFYCKITDNGKGFDPFSLAVKKDRGLGIGNMKKRASLIGGNIDINSSPNKGTTIYIQVPYER
jgi:signal transduction histidine kinase